LGGFFTLGLPSCSYPVNSELKLEVNGHQAQCVDDFSKMKQIAIFSEGDKEKLQLQMCNTYQVQRTCSICCVFSNSWISSFDAAKSEIS
jgi:hypothetical protein